MTRNAWTVLALVLCLAIASGVATTIRAGLMPDPCSEGDGDCIPDQLDKCSLDSRNSVANCDTDNDGYGNVCDADFDQSGTVTAIDFGVYFIPAFKGAPPTRGQDMDCSGSVNSNDFAQYFLPKFKGALGGAFPGPSGLPCAGTQGCN